MVLFDWLTRDDHDDSLLHQVLLIVLLLQYHNSIRDCHILHHSAILLPQHSPWKKLYKSADASSFLHMTGLTRHAFGSLLDYLFYLEEEIARCRRDRYLGLLSFYLSSKMSYSHICLIFGITPSVCSCAINMMLKRMVWLLWGNPLAKVQFPNEAKMRLCRYGPAEGTDGGQHYQFHGWGVIPSTMHR
jgi:hypothetical protein